MGGAGIDGLRAPGRATGAHRPDLQGFELAQKTSHSQGLNVDIALP